MASESESNAGATLAGVVDSAIAAINAVIETLQQKEQQLADVRSRLAAAEAQARLVVAAPPNQALLQSEVEALRTENRRLAGLLQQRERELRQVTGALAQLQAIMASSAAAALNDRNDSAEDLSRPLG
jgi:DNA repair exonuclease SbcCD ATPase subunit